MFVNSVLFAVVLFFGDFFQTCYSRGQCEAESLSEYLRIYDEFPRSCEEFYITNRREVLTAEKLKDVYINDLKLIGGISGIQKNCFKYRTNLGSISIVSNNLPTLNNFTFSGLELRELNLTKNNIVELGLTPFGDSVIGKLDLSYNKISTLLRSSFTPRFVDVRISRNRVSYIEPQCFHSKLEYLNLDHNLLYYINRDHFSNLDNLKELYLNNNRIVTIDFTNNDLKKLTKLDLSYNQIKILNRASLDSLANLKYFNLTHNRIKWMSSTILQIFWKLETLDISLNHLTNFPYSSLPSSVKTFNAFANPWNCDCFFHMEKYLTYNKIVFNCNSLPGQGPVCISYGNRCRNTANDTLVAVFMENISPNLTPYCKGPGSLRGEFEGDYPISEGRIRYAIVRKHIQK